MESGIDTIGTLLKKQDAEITSLRAAARQDAETIARLRKVLLAALPILDQHRNLSIAQSRQYYDAVRVVDAVRAALASKWREIS